MRSYLAVTWCVLASCIANLSVINTAYSIQLTQTTTISATNTSYDGQDLIVNGATLTIDGSHQFNSVQLINGAVLTHSLSPAVKLVLTSTTFFIDASSSINLTGKGRLPTSDVTGASGGSYGGRGGIYDSAGSTNPVFGNSKVPADLGIGGISSAGKTYGGGSIKLIADQLTLHGQITADGQGFNTFFTSQGGGSGGSVYLDVSGLNGTGTLQASGGSGYTFYGGGGGGGGRIAVYYQSANFDFQNNIINKGGVFKPLFGEQGQDGSVYLENTSVVNQAPVANAGLALFVDEQTAVALSGSATDADGVIVSYAWTQLSGPAVSLIDADTATPGFTAPVVLSADSPTVLNFRLTVTDDDGATAIADTNIGVLANNALPVANAGTDLIVEQTGNVTLYGSADDNDGSITAYQWTQINGATVTLTNSNNATATFTAPEVNATELLGFQLTVTDNESAVHSDNVSVTVNPVNTLPVAKIVNPASVPENTAVNLDATASSDADGIITSYRWTQVSGPVVILSNTNSAVANFTAPLVYQDTILGFQLNVLDDKSGLASAAALITVYSVNPDDDFDDLPDLWEIQFFDTLEHDGTADTDYDGATDLQEHALGTDPTVEQQPAQPGIVSPDDIEVNSLQPELTVSNPGQHRDFFVSYEFEIYRDAAMSEQVTSTTGANPGWTVTAALTDNSHYYWRARAAGATLYSDWVSSKFFINTENDAPGAFNISSPQDNVSLANFTPTLSVTNSVDIDEDAISYRFEVFSDGQPVTSAEGILAGADGTTSWTVDIPLLENTWYLWRAIASDEHGLTTVSSSETTFFIDTLNDAPSSPALSAPLDGGEITTLFSELLVNNSTDPEGKAVHYTFELDTENTFDTANKQSSGPVSEKLNATGWSVYDLTDNTWYHWRSKASDGFTESLWMNGVFFVNQFNDAPGTPKTLNPGDQAWVNSLQPTLETYPAIDIDGDAVSYQFEVYKIAADNNKQHELFATGSSDTTFWQLDISLSGSGNYYWHVRAIDEHGLAGKWSDLAMFFADNDGVNDAPVIKVKSSKFDHHEMKNKHRCKNRHGAEYHDDNNDSSKHTAHDDDETDQIKIEWTDYDPDSNARISLYYDTDQFGENGILITQDILEDPDGDFDHYLWDISNTAAGIYFVYAIIDDGNSTTVNYSKSAIVIKDGGGLPFLTFRSAESKKTGMRNQFAQIAWHDMDSNSNATIDFYYDMDGAGFDGTLITGTLAEDPDGNADHFLWNISALAEDTYYIYATISDETNSYRVYATRPYTVKHGNRGRGRNRDKN